MTAEARIKIVADTRDATRAVEEFARGLDAAQFSAQGLAGEIVGELIPAWSNAGSAVVDIGRRLLDVAEQYDELADIQESLGTASQALASSMTQGLIPALDLAQARGQLLAAGLQLTDEQFAAVAASAQVYAQRTGTDGAQAIDRLSNAVIAGNERALRPFGIHLQEGSTRTQGTAQALDQLTAAAGRNAQAIEQSTGGLDHMKAALNTAKEAAVSFYGGIINFALDGIHQFGTAVGSLAGALASGEPGSLSKAFFDATDASHRFAERIPGIGESMAAAAVATRDWAASLFGLRRAAASADAAVANLGSGGPSMLSDDEEAAITFDMTAGTGTPVMMQGVRGAGEGDYSTRRRGGGGGGGGDRAGARGAIDQAISDAEVSRLRGNRPDGRGGPETGITRNRAGGNAQGGASNAGVAVQNTGLTRTANAVKNLGDAYEQLGTTATGVLDALGTAVSGHFEAWAMGRETMGEALAGMTADLFKWMGQQALKKAGMEAVEAIAAAARYDFGAAALHAAAAVGFGALAGGSFYVAGQVGGSSGRSTHGRDERSSSRDLGAGRERGATGGPPVAITIYNAPGAIIGDGGMQTFSRTLLDNINSGVRQRQPGFRLDPQVIR